MKTKMFYVLPVLIFIGFIFFTATENPPSEIGSDPKYVGVNSCVGACHKTESQGSQLSIWESSKHANAFKVLQTDEANKIAEGKGFTTPAAETPECLKCHTLGKTADASTFEETFDITQGVQCESCHGAGSEYKKLSIMKDKQKSIDAGLQVHSEGEAFCTGCHNSESPTFKGFNYAEMWDKIKHPKPASE